jgi:phage tail sheath gpL-like
MPISFSNIPANLKVPLYWVEVDPSMAGLPVIDQPSLLVGTMNIYGTADPNTAYAIGTQSEVDIMFGLGSELSRMAISFFANNFANEVWAIGLPEPTGGTEATGAITITQPPTDAGSIALYIGGERVEDINITTTDTIGDISLAIADAINVQTDLPVVADGATVPGTVTLTARWKGVGGNDISMMLNYYGSIGGEVTPPGLGITLSTGTAQTATGTGSGVGNSLTVSALTGTIGTGYLVSGTGVPPGTTILDQQSGPPGGDGVYTTSVPTTATTAALTFTAPVAPISFMSGGVGTPDTAAAIAALGEKNYEYVALPYTDSNTLFEWEDDYGFGDNGRWGWKRQLYGHLFSAKRDTYPNLITWGNTRNSGVTSVMGVEPGSPSPVYEWVAAYTAKAQRALINDPARPLQTLSLNQIKLAPLKFRFNIDELNSLALNGIATQKAGSDNQPMISRETTTYQLNLYGFSDTAYELVTTLATLARLIRNQRQEITSKFPRCKLADDGTRFGPGQAIVTPGIIKAELISQYSIDMFNGLVENLEAFKSNLLVERDPNDPNRVNVLYPPDLINQLRIFAVLAQFRLQYDLGLDTAIIGPSVGFTGVLPGSPVG